MPGLRYSSLHHHKRANPPNQCVGAEDRHADEASLLMIRYRLGDWYFVCRMRWGLRTYRVGEKKRPGLSCAGRSSLCVIVSSARAGRLAEHMPKRRDLDCSVSTPRLHIPDVSSTLNTHSWIVSTAALQGVVGKACVPVQHKERQRLCEVDPD